MPQLSLNSISLSRYTPVRSDGVVGDLVLSEPSDVLYPGIAIFFF